MAQKIFEFQCKDLTVQKGDCRPEKENPVQLEAAGSLFEGSGPLTVQKGDCRPEKENPVQLEAAGSLFEGSGPLTVQKGDCRPFFFSRAPGNLAISRGMSDSAVGC